MQNVTIDGVEYAPVSARPTGTRAVVVVDRGWIFASRPRVLVGFDRVCQDGRD
jgi:hypothetical protein